MPSPWALRPEEEGSIGVDQKTRVEERRSEGTQALPVEGGFHRPIGRSPGSRFILGPSPSQVSPVGCRRASSSLTVAGPQRIRTAFPIFLLFLFAYERSWFERQSSTRGRGAVKARAQPAHKTGALPGLNSGLTVQLGRL